MNEFRVCCGLLAIDVLVHSRGIDQLCPHRPRQYANGLRKRRGWPADPTRRTPTSYDIETGALATETEIDFF